MIGDAAHPGQVRPVRPLMLRAIVALYVGVLVALPMGAVVVLGASEGIDGLSAMLRDGATRHALWLSLWTAAVVAVVNLVVGVIIAWVLVRHDLPGRALVSALIDLPLALPTLVAGIMLASLWGPSSLLGTHLAMLGVEVIFAPTGIVLALLFVTVPFVVRAVEPVLSEVEEAEYEAAATLGAGAWKTFCVVAWPAIRPAAISGAVRAFGRALGEFGSIVVVAGNLPFRTLTAPVYIFGEIESASLSTAALAASLLFLASLAIHGAAYLIERRAVEGITSEEAT